VSSFAALFVRLAYPLRRRFKVRPANLKEHGMDTVDRRTFLKVGGGAALASLGLPWLLTACGPGSGSASNLQLSNDKPTWQDWFQTEGNQAKSAVKVGWTPREYSDNKVYQAAIKTSAGSSKAPDLFTWQSNWGMKDVVDAGFVGDLTTQWDQAGDVYSADLRKLFTFGGKTYGAPLYTAPWVVFYSKSVFEKYQLQPPTTWDEMQHVLATLKGNGIAPLGATVDGVWSFLWFQTLLVGNDPELYTAVMAGKAKYTDPGVMDVMNLWAQMIKAGYFTDPSAVTFSTRGTNFATPFKQGKAAMAEMGTWYEATITAAGMKPGVDYDAFIMPNIKPGVQNTIVIESGPLCVATHGRHKDSAEKALAWFMSKEGQQEWVKLTGFISGRSDVPATSPVDQKIMAAMKAGNYQQVSRYFEGTPNDIVQTALDEFQKFMLHPGDPKPILNAIQSTADSVWKTLG
jgi:multiple sugar transport system substrate-binding protein